MENNYGTFHNTIDLINVSGTRELREDLRPDLTAEESLVRRYLV